MNTRIMGSSAKPLSHDVTLKKMHMMHMCSRCCRLFRSDRLLIGITHPLSTPPASYPTFDSRPAPSTTCY